MKKNLRITVFIIIAIAFFSLILYFLKKENEYKMSFLSEKSFVYIISNTGKPKTSLSSVDSIYYLNDTLRVVLTEDYHPIVVPTKMITKEESDSEGYFEYKLLIKDNGKSYEIRIGIPDVSVFKKIPFDWFLSLKHHYPS